MARGQKQLNPIVTMGNKITKAVRSDKAEFRTGKTRPQPLGTGHYLSPWGGRRILG